MRLSEASESYLTVRVQEGFSRYTIDAYRLQHALLIRDVGDIDILIEFSFATGCRVAEIQRINRTDIDWQRGAVTVQ